MPRHATRHAPGAGAIPFGFLLATLLTALPAGALTLGFEDLGAGLPIDGNFFYDGRSAYDPLDPDATDFQSGSVVFNNEFDDFGGGCCWQGFAYSQTTDTVGTGPANQYSAITGGGVGGSPTYGVGFPGGVVGASGVSTIDLGQELDVQGGYFTNTAWAVHSMQDGDGFAKAFGGVSGDDPDFLRLTISGFDGLGMPTGAVEFLLADYRFADNGLDYIVVDWTWVDLTSLGSVRYLDFTIESSDTSFGFINTPAYFAMDDLVAVPEPGSAGLLALGLAVLARRRATRPRPGCRSRSRRSPAPS